MRKSVAPFLLLFAVPSCGESSAPLVGTFELDHAMMKGVIAKLQADNPEGAPTLGAMFEGMKLEVTFEPEGTFESTTVVSLPGRTGTMERKGTWSLDKETLVLRTTHVDGRKLEEHETNRGTFQNGQVRFVAKLGSQNDQMLEYVLKRK